MTISPSSLQAVVLINVILAVLPQGEAEHVGRGILVAVLFVQRANPFIVHKDHADLGRSFKFFIVQHRIAAAPDQDAQAGRDLDGILFVADEDFGWTLRASSFVSVLSSAAGSCARRPFIRFDDLLHQTWRTTSFSLSCTWAMPWIPRSTRSASTKPLRLLSGRSIWVISPGHHDLAVGAHAGQKHFHLFGRRVLRLVQNDESVVQCCARAYRRAAPLRSPAFQTDGRMSPRPKDRTNRRTAGAGKGRPCSADRRAKSRAFRPLPRRAASG